MGNTSTVTRFDRGELRDVVRTDAGYLQAPAYLTRAGVFSYRLPDGSTRRELRTPDEVFHADSLQSLAGVPLTDGHPYEVDGGRISSATARKVAVGSVGTDVRQDGELVASTVVVTDGATVARVDAREVQELSCGYDCQLELAPGVHPTWGRYDAIQRRIRYHHVALVERGRAGSDVRLRMDSHDAVQVGDEPEPGTPDPAPPSTRTDGMTTKIRLDGIDYDVTEQAAQAVTRALSAKDERLTALDGELAEAKKASEATQAKLDAAEAAKNELQGKLDAASKPESIRAAVQARLGLERTAREVLGEEPEGLKLDEADDADIRKAVIGKRFPEVKLDEKSDAYVEAMFDAAVAAKPAEPRNDGLGNARKAASQAGTRTDAASARERMLEKNRNAWRADPTKPAA